MCFIYINKSKKQAQPDNHRYIHRYNSILFCFIKDEGIAMQSFRDYDTDNDSYEWRSGLRCNYFTDTSSDLLQLLSSPSRDFLVTNNGDQVCYCVINRLFSLSLSLYPYLSDKRTNSYLRSKLQVCGGKLWEYTSMHWT